MNTPQGVDIHRYNRSTDFLLSPSKVPSNTCFCRQSTAIQRRRSRPMPNDNGRGCNYDGILDLGTCYTGYGENIGYNESLANTGAVPLMLTAVHFSGPFSKSISREVRGVVPAEQIYKSLLDIEPVSGIVLHRTLKYQFNLHLSPIPVGNNRSTREMVVPLLWQDEQFTVNNEHLNSIKYFFVYPFKYREFAMLGAAVLGGVSLLMATIFFCCCCCGKSKSKQKERLINEPTIRKGTGKYSGKVTPVDEANNPVNNNNPNGNGNLNEKQIAWKNGKYKHQQTEDEDEFQFEGDDDEEYREEDEEYDPNAVISPNKRIMESNGQQNKGKPGRMGENNYGGNQYPLERLKRDMPARQSSTNLSQNNVRRQWPNGNPNTNDNHPPFGKWPYFFRHFSLIFA